MADGTVYVKADARQFGAIVRSLAVRFVAGSMLLSAVFSGGCAIVATTPSDQFSCALASAVCAVAYYHYGALVKLREPKLKPSNAVEAVFDEAKADACRHSDWLATLGALVIDLHSLLDNHTAWFGVGYSVLMVVLMVALGGFVRFGCDELAPSRERDTLVRVLGVMCFLAAWVCLVLVFCNLLIGSTSHANYNMILLFVLPWVGYGAIALASIAVRQFYPLGYPFGLSVAKTILYSVLDVWSKASFAMWVGARALGKEDLIFG